MCATCGRHRRVEHAADRVDVRQRAVRGDVEADGVVHPRVRGDDEERARHAGEDHRHGAQDVRARRQAAPAEQVDADEDRLDEEREALEHEREPEDLAVGAHQAGPQDAHLEGQEGARHRARGEQHPHGLGPRVGELVQRRRRRCGARATRRTSPSRERRRRGRRRRCASRARPPSASGRDRGSPPPRPARPAGVPRPPPCVPRPGGADHPPAFPPCHVGPDAAGRRPASGHVMRDTPRGVLDILITGA